MAEVVTLYIDDTSLRLLVAKGKRVEKWAQLPLEPGLVSDGAIVDEAEVAGKIKELLIAQGVKTKKVVAGLSGLHCPTRVITLPKLSKALLPEAVRQEVESIVPVPLEQLYISWQPISATGEETQVFFIALDRNAVDVLIKTLRRAGLEPYLIDVKPLALARVVNKATAIIVDVQPTAFDIVIMVDGIPQPVRSLPLPSKAVTSSEKLPTVKAELERTIKFYNAGYPEKPLDSSTPIFISGEMVQETEACQFLANELDYPVVPLSPPLECPEDLSPSQYMVNIGLALKEVSLPKGEANFPVVNLNALPEAYKPKPISLPRIFITTSIIIATIGSLLPLAMLVWSTATDTALLRGELYTINQQIEQRLSQMQAQRQDIAELETKVGVVETSRDDLYAVIDYFDNQHYVVNGALEETISALAQTIDLSNISHVDDELTISGMAASDVAISTFAKRLSASGRFADVIISATKKTKDGVTFTLILWDEW
jgi:type IV pilus assembly protein PilM